MAVRQLRVSDISGDIIKDDTDVVTMVVLDHALIDAPVQLDISKQEAASLDIEQTDFVILELVSDGGDKTERVVIQQKRFDELFTSLAVDEVLAEAEKYGQVSTSGYQAEEPRRRGRPAGSGAAKPAGDKVNYKELPAAGLPHRGRTTEDEAATVRANLDEVNKNRVAAGHPPIDPANEKDAARYGFDAVKVEDRPKLSPEFKA